MTDMGRHNLLNGHRGDDGAAALPVLQVRQLGPVSGWPPPAPGDAVAPRQELAADNGKDALARWCDIALWVIAALIAAASAASFAESYRGLWLWARHHGLAGFWAAAFPAQIDVFIAVGEVALFVALARQWNKRSRVGAWLVTLAGLCVSVAGNVGHVVSHDIASRLTAGVPPVAATAALAVGLGVLKRVVGGDDSDKPFRQHRPWFWQRHALRQEAPATMPAPVSLPPPGDDKTDDAQRDAAPRRQPSRPRPQAKRKPLSGSDKARDILKGKTGPLSKADKADVAKRAGVSVRTVERLAVAASNGHDPEDSP